MRQRQTALFCCNTSAGGGRTMTTAPHWQSFATVVLLGGSAVLGTIIGNGRARRKGAEPKIFTAYQCMRALQRLGWKPAGAGPNYACVYLNKADEKIALAVAPEDPVTKNVLRELVSDFKAAEFGGGRAWVAVYQRELEFGIAEDAAAQGVTLLRFDRLHEMEAALAATAVAAAARKVEETKALTRAYDPPMAAPMGAPAAVAPNGPILETENVACFMRDRGGDDLLITFANQWLRHDGKSFWAASVASALNLSVIGLVTKEPCWYPADDMAALVPAILKRIDGRFPRRILYGHSQGGYAALKHSGALGASVVLAFSPQYSIDRRIVADDRVNKYYTGNRHAGMWVEPGNTSGALYIFHDPYDAADARHAAKYADAVPAHLVKMPFAGHATEPGLSNPERFAGLLEASRTGDLAPVQRFVARQRVTRAERALLMALALAATKPRIATSILEKYGPRWKPDHIANVCFRLATAGQAAQALEPALAAARGAPGSANAQGAAALVALEARRLDIAQRQLDLALHLEPYSPKWLNAAQRLRTLAMAAQIGQGAVV